MQTNKLAEILQIWIQFVRQRGRLTVPTPTLETNKLAERC